MVSPSCAVQRSGQRKRRQTVIRFDWSWGRDATVGNAAADAFAAHRQKLTVSVVIPPAPISDRTRASLTRASVAKKKSRLKMMDCRVKPGNDSADRSRSNTLGISRRTRLDPLRPPTVGRYRDGDLRAQSGGYSLIWRATMVLLGAIRSPLSRPCLPTRPDILVDKHGDASLYNK